MQTTSLSLGHTFTGKKKEKEIRLGEEVTQSGAEELDYLRRADRPQLSETMTLISQLLFRKRKETSGGKTNNKTVQE